MASLALNGCSFLAPSRQTISILASEPDASIYINGTFSGQGCARASVPRNQPLDLLVEKTGFQPIQRTIDKRLAPVGMLDIFMGARWLLPLLGLLAPGAYELECQNVAIPLKPLIPAPADSND